MNGSLNVIRQDGSQQHITAIEQVIMPIRSSDDEITLEIHLWSPGDDGKPEQDIIEVTLVGLDRAFFINCACETINAYYGLSKDKYKKSIGG